MFRQSSYIVRVLCTPGVSKENVLVQVAGCAKIRDCQRRQCRAGVSVCVRSVCCDERLEEGGNRAGMKDSVWRWVTVDGESREAGYAVLCR